MPRFTKDLFVTWSALTRTTERATRRCGARYFLPALFVDRFANMGGLDRELFVRQLDECTTFQDEGWVTYWRTLGQTHLDAADAELALLGAPSVRQILGPDGDATASELGAALAPAATVLADRSPENCRTLVAEFVAEHPEDRAAAVAIDELVKAMVYLFAASWPGWSRERLRAYGDSQRLMHVLLLGLAPHVGFRAERIELDIDGEDAVAYGVFPEGDQECPTVLVTNGLEGTIQEALIPALRLRDRGIAMVTMEMPSTFQYRRPLSVETEGLYDAVIEQLAAHPRVDADRMGMMGISFGAHWSTRMAARSKRLKAVVSNGGLYHRSFGTAATFGMPEIMLWTLQRTTGARNLMDLGHKLHALSLKKVYPTIRIPILAINGDTDTLVSTQDTIDLADGAPLGELLLYPGDDHCAMGHYTEWLETSTEWLHEKLVGGGAPGRH
jgi:esterase FrsA